MRGPYTFVIEREEFIPSSFGSLREIRSGEAIYNPDQLYADAIRAAERIAFDLAEPDGPTVVVEILGRVGRDGAEPVRASFVSAFEFDSVVDVTSPNYKWGTRFRHAARKVS